MLDSIKIFYHNVFSQVKTTGSIAPSSRFLAQAMIEHISHDRGPLKILEAGPGTGPFTFPLAKTLEDQDRLDLCELNDDFVSFMRKSIEHHPAMQPHRDRVHLYHKPVQELEGEDQYDYIVSSLPFNNFPPSLVLEILETYEHIIKPGGILTFFEYAWIRNIKLAFVGEEEKKRLQSIGEIFADVLEARAIKTKFVLLNLPPCYVYTLQF